jgi:sulfate transport system ATP-binding protein
MSIIIKNIRKSFGTFNALDGVSLTIPDNKLVALLGPSGSGKTTLLRIIAQLDQLDEGEIEYYNQDGSQNRHGLQVGFVFQHYALFRHMTVFENIAFGLTVMKRSERPSKEKIRTRVKEIIELIQLENLSDRYPSQLSGGQRQRVALARALAVNPSVLLLDEPFGALDAKVRVELRKWLRNLHARINVTSIFVTHDQEEALEVADIIVVMDKGRIIQVGSPDEVFHHPVNEFVYRFLGQVNQFRGRYNNGMVDFGNFRLDQVPGDRPEATSVTMISRPHEIFISTTKTHPGSIPCSVEFIHTAGPKVKVELKDGLGRPLLVEISHAEFTSAGFSVLDPVYVTLKNPKIL